MVSDSLFQKEKTENGLGFLVWQTSLMWHRTLKETLDSFDLTLPQFMIMVIVFWCQAKSVETTQIKIVKLSKLDKMTTSQSLRKLEGRGLLVRFENKNDSRAKVVSLTEEGRALVSTLVPLIEERDQRFFARVPQTAQALLIQSLSALLEDSC